MKTNLQHLIFADFNNIDQEGRVRLNTIGTMADILKNKIILKSGFQLNLTDYDEFQIVGVVEYSLDEKIWVAKISTLPPS